MCVIATKLLCLVIFFLIFSAVFRNCGFSRGNLFIVSILADFELIVYLPSCGSYIDETDHFHNY